jgi:hypothetical protein
VPANFSSLIAATAQWLTRAYPAPPGALSEALADVQARQAATVAAWLRYPTLMDAAVADVVGPGGSGRLDWIAGVEPPGPRSSEFAWRTWVDEVVASWAACLLTDADLAAAAVAAIATCDHMAGLECDFRRLTRPDARDWRAAVLLRHPDLVASIADLHRAELLERLGITDDPADDATDDPAGAEAA